MDEKPTFGTILPLFGLGGAVAVCCAGPVLLGSAAGGISSWLAGLGGTAAVGIAVFVGVAVFGFMRWRKSRSRPVEPTGSSQPIDGGLR